MPSCAQPPTILTLAPPRVRSNVHRKRSVTMQSTPTNSSTEMLVLPSPPNYGSPGSFMHIPTIAGGSSSGGGGSAELNSPTYLRSPHSSGGFSVESYGSGTPAPPFLDSAKP